MSQLVVVFFVGYNLSLMTNKWRINENLLVRQGISFLSVIWLDDVYSNSSSLADMQNLEFLRDKVVTYKHGGEIRIG